MSGENFGDGLDGLNIDLGQVTLDLRRDMNQLAREEEQTRFESDIATKQAELAQSRGHPGYESMLNSIVKKAQNPQLERLPGMAAYAEAAINELLWLDSQKAERAPLDQALTEGSNDNHVNVVKGNGLRLKVAAALGGLALLGAGLQYASASPNATTSVDAPTVKLDARIVKQRMLAEGILSGKL